MHSWYNGEMQGNIYCISDTHWDHDNIRRYCDRPFQSKEEMNEVMTRNWNSVVKPEDVVIFGGDFFLRRDMRLYESKIKSIYNTLNGKKICLRGNHDVENPWLDYYKSDSLLMKYKNRILFFRHHPPESEEETWPAKQKGSIFVYGHVHQKSKAFYNTFNMSAENVNYTPIHLDELLKRVNQKTIISPLANKYFSE